MPQKYKFQKPFLSPFHIDRDILFETIDSSRVTLVAAPTGYGKSNLISSWLEQRSIQWVWVNLESSDSDVELFIRQILAQTSKFDRELKHFLTKSENMDQEKLKDHFFTVLSNLGSRFCLILDDYHVIRNPVLHKIIDDIVENTEILLKITTRISPPFSYFLWKKKGGFKKIIELDLSLSKLEMCEFLKTRFPGTTEIFQSQLLQLTGGWFAGVNLVLSNISQMQETTVPLLSQFDFELMMKEFMQSIVEKDRIAILKLSLLKIITKDLIRDLFKASEVTDDFISRLFAEELFLIRIDGDENYFKFHQLYAEQLQDVARSTLSEDEIFKFYVKASEWYIKHNILQEAFTIMLYCKEGRYLMDTFNKLRLIYIENKHWFKLKDLIRQINQKEIESPIIDIADFWMSTYDGRTDETFKLSKKMGEFNFKAKGVDVEVGAEMAILSCHYEYNVNRDFRKCIKRSQLALQVLPNNYTYARGYAWGYLLSALCNTGYYTKAKVLANKAMNSDINYHEMSFLLGAVCYIDWMELNLLELEVGARRWLELAVQNDDQEGRCHALHFLRIQAFEAANWVNYKHYSKLQEDCLQYGLGFITNFSKLLQVSFLALREIDNWQDAMRGVIAEIETKNNELAKKYASAHYLMLGIDRLGAHELEYLYQRSKLDFMPSIISIQDPNLSCLAYLWSTQLESNQEEANELYVSLREHIAIHHNNSAELRLGIIRATFDPSLKKYERIEAFEQAIKQSIKHGAYGVFYEHQRTLIELNSLKSNFDYIVRSFIEDLVYKLKLVIPIVRKLTEREMEIIEYLKQSQTNKELAEVLEISEKTLKNHLTSIYKKINVKSKEEALELLKFNS